MLRGARTSTESLTPFDVVGFSFSFFVVYFFSRLSVPSSSILCVQLCCVDSNLLERGSNVNELKRACAQLTEAFIVYCRLLFLLLL